MVPYRRDDLLSRSFFWHVSLTKQAEQVPESMVESVVDCRKTQPVLSKMSNKAKKPLSKPGKLAYDFTCIKIQ